MKHCFNLYFCSAAIYFMGLCCCASAQVVTVDNYYNQETQFREDGVKTSYHYLWNDEQQTGFSIFGNSFLASGAKTLSVLNAKPTSQNLENSDVYIIVDPDNHKDNPSPNHMNDVDALAISKWVKRGGVLLILANDETNADLQHLNILVKKFGFIFKNDLILHVTDDKHFEDGALNTGVNEVFKTSRKIFIKDASSIQIAKTAKALLKTKNGENVIVVAKYGNGTVMAIGDPWLYNEYTNGRLPGDFQNDLAAQDIASFLLSKTKRR